MNEDACAIRTRAFKVNEQLVQSDRVASEKNTWVITGRTISYPVAES